MEQIINNYTDFKRYLDLKSSVKINNDIDVIALKNGHIKKQNITKLAKEYNNSLSDFTRLLLISFRTIQRYKNDKVLSPDVADHAITLARLLVYGVSVFGEKDKYINWINIPSKVLGGKKPIEIMDSNTGCELVKDELTRIMHGVYI